MFYEIINNILRRDKNFIEITACNYNAKRVNCFLEDLTFLLVVLYILGNLLNMPVKSYLACSLNISYSSMVVAVRSYNVVASHHLKTQRYTQTLAYVPHSRVWPFQSVLKITISSSNCRTPASVWSHFTALEFQACPVSDAILHAQVNTIASGNALSDPKVNQQGKDWTHRDTPCLITYAHRVHLQDTVKGLAKPTPLLRYWTRHLLLRWIEFGL